MTDTTDTTDGSTAKPIDQQELGTFLDALSAKAPTPGGGAAAAVTGATAAATAAMVISYSLGKKSLAEHEEHNATIGIQLTRAREMFLQLGEEDALGYAALNDLWTLDKNDPARVQQWDKAVRGAITPPRAMMALALELLRLCERMIETTNRQLRSDLGVAAVLGQAACRAAAWSVRINIPLLPEGERDELADAVGVMLGQAADLCETVESGCV